MESMNSQSAAQAPADRLLERRRREPRGFAVSAEAQSLGATYSAQMDRGEFDYNQLARDIAAAS